MEFQSEFAVVAAPIVLRLQLRNYSDGALIVGHEKHIGTRYAALCHCMCVLEQPQSSNSPVCCGGLRDELSSVSAISACPTLIASFMTASDLMRRVRGAGHPT